MARPPAPSRLVDTLEGDDLAKRRLKVFLQIWQGERTNAEACERLEVSPTTLRKLLARALQGALEALAPKAPGRPHGPEADPIVAELRAELAQHKQELVVERGRTQIALCTTPPALSATPDPRSKKNATRRPPVVRPA